MPLRGVQHRELHRATAAAAATGGEDDGRHAVLAGAQPVQPLPGGEVAQQLVRRRRAVHGHAHLLCACGELLLGAVEEGEQGGDLVPEPRERPPMVGIVVEVEAAEVAEALAELEHGAAVVAAD